MFKFYDNKYFFQFWTAGLLGIVLCLPSTPRADTLKLRNGTVLEGKFRGFNPSGSISFETGGRVQDFPLSAVGDMTVKPPAPPRKKPELPAEVPSPQTPVEPAPIVPVAEVDARASAPLPLAALVVPGLGRIRSRNYVTGGLTLGLFLAGIVRGLYYQDRLNRELARARRDPLYHLYLNPRGAAFERDLTEMRNSLYAAGLVYAIHLTDFFFFEAGESANLRHKGPEISIGIVLRF